MTKKRTKSQDENITTEDLGNGYTRVRVEGPNSVQRARDFIDTNFDNPAYYQGDLKDLEVVAYDPKSHQSKVLDDFRRSVGFPTASEIGTTYKYVEPSKPKVDDGFTNAERERYLHNLEKSGFNFDYADRVLKADRHASQYNPENFLKATGINALDPTQWVGALSDKLTGKVDENDNPIGFWQSLGYGNSGLVTDNFMRKHPILGTTVNMIGGGATIGLGNKALNLTRPLVQQGYTTARNIVKPTIVGMSKKAMPFVAKHFLAPAAAGMAVDEAQRALTGTTLTEQVSNYLQEKGWNPVAAEFVGGLTNPGYWVNFGGTGQYTGPLFNKIGLGLSRPSAYSALTPELDATLFPRKTFRERVTNAVNTTRSGVQTLNNKVSSAGNVINQKVLQPSLNFLDRNLYRLQGVANPWFLFTKKGGPKQTTTADFPSFKFVRNPQELQKLNDQLRYDFPKERGTVADYLLSNNDTNNRKLFGEAMDLQKPNINVRFYGPGKGFISESDEIIQPLSAGISATDIALGDEDRNPYIRGLEYFSLGRYGINSLARRRLTSILNNSDNYMSRFDKINVALNRKFSSLSAKLSNMTPAGYERVWSRGPSRSTMFVPEGYDTTITKKGFNYKHATFDDLLSLLDKHKGIVRDNTWLGSRGNVHKFTIDDSRNTVYDESGRAIARRGDDGKITVVNDQVLRDILSKNIDIIDYATGNRYTGKISVGDDGAVNIPEEYTRILRNNIDYVQNTLFPGSGVKVFGSAAGVTDAGFPHATHDIDFYITQKSLDDLISKGMLSEKDRINPGTYTYKLKPKQFGKQGNIDLNVLEQTPEGMATGLRAEELYRQYFPDEYFLALRRHQAAINNGEISSNTPLPIGRTPQELLDAMTPSSKTIMDSFDIDISNPAKSKHTLRSWAHLIYSDPQQVSQGLNQYAKSLVGPNASLFPATVAQLGNKELNLQALRKIGVNLTDSELDIIASDPQRMKNVLDAWYLMDNTAMRYIRGTWPGTTGNSANNFIKSATTWDPINNLGNAYGSGLNTTIGGDSQWHGDLKAFILPRSEYKSTELLDLIDEVNNNFGRNSTARQMLHNVDLMPKEQQISGLQDIYNSLGWNFLQNGEPYGKGMYASATRPFDIATDAVGFQKAGYNSPMLHPMIPRIQKISEGEHPLTRTGIGATFKAQRTLNKPIDFNVEHTPRLQGFLNANSDRTISIAHPFNFIDSEQVSSIRSKDFIPAKVEAILGGIPLGFTGAYQLTNYFQDKSHRDTINSFINNPDDVILGMPEQDRKMFTQEGVNSLYQKYRTDPYLKDEDDQAINSLVFYDLSTLYDKYAPKED